MTMAAAPNEQAALELEDIQSPSQPAGNRSVTVTGADVETPPPPFPTLKSTATNMTTASNGKPYSSFTSGEKWFIVVLSALAGTFSPISSNIYVPAIPTLSTAFGVSNEKINLTVTVYLVFQALTPAIWGSAADSFGRRPIYIICLLIYLLSCVGTALCPTSDYWLLMLMRVVQATGGSAVIAIGTGVIADIAMPQERGKYLGVFNLQSTAGPAIGPLLGGIFAATLGWRSIFWFLTIACGVVLVPMIFFQPETLRSLVGDGSLPPPLLNCTPAALLRRKREVRDMKARGENIEDMTAHRSKYKPWASFLLVLEPEIALMFVWSSLYYAQWYAVLTIYSTLLKDVYGVNEIIIGVCYLPNGLGTVYRREKKRVGGDHRSKPAEFRLERTRFYILPYQAGLSLVATVAMGWSLAAKAPIAVPIVLNFFVGVATGNLTTATIYGIDLFPGQGGAVTATFNLVRCLFGAVAVSIIQIINRAMGPGWSFVLLSGICLLGTPMPLILLRYGPKWRIRRLEKSQAKERRKKGDGTGTGSQ